MEHPVFSDVRTLFNLKITKAEPFQRESGDPILSFFISTQKQGEYFLKELQSHSLRDGMDRIYEQFSTLAPQGYRLILPIAYDSGRYIFKSDGKLFLLFKRESIRHFETSEMSHPRLLEILQSFHRDISEFDLPAQGYRTYESWLNRGPLLLKREYGEGLPFVTQFEEFMANRFAQLGLAKGNIHWDVHQYNFCFDEKGSLAILDLDLAQQGDYACDLIRATNMYLRLEGGSEHLENESLQVLMDSIPDGKVPLTKSDLKLLLCRTVMIAPSQWENSQQRRKECVEYLQSLEKFVS